MQVLRSPRVTVRVAHCTRAKALLAGCRGGAEFRMQQKKPPGSAMTTTRLRDAYAVNRPAVVSELIDGETVMMNLETGHYFSARDTASRVWSWLEEGLGTQDIVARLEGEYAGERGTMGEALAAFLASLEAQGLVVAGPERPETRSDGGVPCERREDRPPFVPPVLEVYSDMRDLLFLDPIHDVDESGWPSAAAVERQPG